jgi:hypothetical protein
MKKRPINVTPESSEWQSVGREPRVYPAKEPSDLLGVHGEIMAAGLEPGERLRYMLYSPIWDGEDAPFGIKAVPASHGVAVTDTAILISANRHDGTSPTFRRIPFDHILCVQLGTALLLGWFSVRYAEDVGVPATTSLLFTATGVEYFSAAVREYRMARMRQSGGHHVDFVSRWEEFWKQQPADIVNRLKPLLCADENYVSSLHCEPKWSSVRWLWRRKPVCVVEESLLVATDAGLLWADRKREFRPNMYSFGINVSCIAPEDVVEASISSKAVDGLHVPCFDLVVKKAETLMAFEIPFDTAFEPEAKNIATNICGVGRCVKR